MDTRSILNTKLYKPEVKNNYIFRKEIIDRLEQNRNAPLTIVTAPAGYGKSITISEWLDYTKTKLCWISVDEELNDLRTFLLYFVTSVKSIFSDSLEELSNILEGNNLPPDNIISNTLINELDEIGEDLTLVLDDYYFIMNSQIHNLIQELIKYPPAKFHLVIISRRDPPLNLSTLKSYDKLNYIRMTDLSFNRNETRELVDKTSDLKVSDNALNVILEKTEGWIVGLRLALLALKEVQDVEKTLDELRGDKHYLTEYLINEVYQKADENVKKILLMASLFERFNEDLLKELINFMDNKDIIDPDTYFRNLFDRFRKSTLFIIPLDNNGIWFRYHHFFQDFMLKKLKKENSKSIINEWHKKSSAYFEKNELFDEAYHHALESGDIDLAAGIFSKNRISFFNTDQIRRIREWFGKLPAGTVENHLDLLLTRAILQEEVYDFTSMENDLKIAEKLIENMDQNSPAYNQLLGEFHTAYALLTYSTGKYEEAHLHSKKAVALIPDTTQLIGLYAFSLTNFTLNALGNFKDAITPQLENLKKLPRSEEIPRLYGNIGIAILYSFQGNLHEIYKSGLECLNLGEKYKLWVSMGYGSYYLSEISYQWNHLEEAVKFTKTLDDHYYHGRAYWVLPTLYAKAFSFHALGRDIELAETILDIEAVTEATLLEIYHELTKAFKVDLAIRQGNINKALELSKSTNFNSIFLDYTFYFQQLTFIRLLIITDHSRNFNEIEELINKYIEIGRRGHKYNLLMQVLLLQAVHLKYQRENESAIESLKEALGLAEPGGFIRIFLVLGEPMKDLLEEYHKIEPQNNYISKLIKAFADEELRIEKLKQMNNKMSPASLSKSDKISAQEIKLLNLVAQGYRNKEIAENLYLSQNSVRKYLSNVYNKLGVGNRVAAVSSARELGLIKQLG